MTLNKEWVLELDQVHKVYPGPPEQRALNGVSLKLEYGAFAALTGPSGSGKTSLLNIASGLDKPTDGTIRIAGRELSKMSRAELGRFRSEKLGFVFQAYNLLPVLTALENAEFTSLMRGDPPGEVRARALECLSQVGLSKQVDRYPHQMSGGQQQRVAVARALVTKPEIILADEPTANLDSQSAFQLIDLFDQLNREKGVTFLFSTHDQRLVSRVKTVISLMDGRWSPPFG
jgi:putative ABC transport system ATP-binding protein